jgi:catechol 2,3-dioxygenase-like lactoylglutathione lyase family enzyme
VTVQHVTLELRESQVEACVDFSALLGFTRVAAPSSLADRAAWLQSGSVQIHLMWVDEPVVPPRGHVAVVAPEYDAVVGALRAAGFEVEPRREHWGVPRSYVHDPAGHLVEVMAAAPPASTAAG